MIASEVYRRVGHNRLSVLSIPVQTREVGKLKKRLTLTMILVALLAATIPLLSGCAASTHIVNATVYGTGSSNLTEAAVAADQALAEITKSPDIDVPATIEPGKLTIASDAAYPPLEYSARIVTEESGEESKSDPQTVGFEIDLCNAIAKKLGLEPVFVTIGYSDIQSALSEGTADIAASAMITTPGLLTQLAATDTYLSADLAICTRAGVELADSDALQGKVIGVQQGSIGESAVESTAGIAETRLYLHVLGAFDDLMDSKVDAVVVMRPVATWILSTDAGYANALQITGGMETGEGYAMWSTKGNEALIAAINAALQELQQAPQTATVETSTTLEATTTTADGTTATEATVTTLEATTTTQQAVEPAKSVYQLLLEKWGLATE